MGKAMKAMKAKKSTRVMKSHKAKAVSSSSDSSEESVGRGKGKCSGGLKPPAGALVERHGEEEWMDSRHSSFWRSCFPVGDHQANISVTLTGHEKLGALACRLEQTLVLGKHEVSLLRFQPGGPSVVRVWNSSRQSSKPVSFHFCGRKKCSVRLKGRGLIHVARWKVTDGNEESEPAGRDGLGKLDGKRDASGDALGGGGGLPLGGAGEGAEDGKLDREYTADDLRALLHEARDKLLSLGAGGGDVTPGRVAREEPSGVGDFPPLPPPLGAVKDGGPLEGLGAPDARPKGGAEPSLVDVLRDRARHFSRPTDASELVLGLGVPRVPTAGVG